MDFSDSQARLVRDLITEVMLRRQQLGAPIPQRVRDLLNYVSAHGHETVPPPTQLTEEADDLIDTEQAAEILGCSTRHARRLAADLDGTLFAGRWMFNRQAVTDYSRNRTCPTPTTYSAA
ncbi:helix-turn-helix domain-containing protein [Mycolicibacterium mengxianglii]|uniref:helix-turn-helix domain-containing protein n=1 Tax=Mycolicibacterium mengxianglii TaxID=2736649 RepID=UPI0018D06287|nr:helix-turn-helix domain-containing protein [Mycolicibacterium mengxianglii]